MPPSKVQRDRSREAILNAAGRLFRKHGYDGIGIDGIMTSAGLTRGAFYAHFPSKAALFAAVVSEDNAFLARLRARGATDAAGLRHEAQAIAAYYLEPANRERIGEICTLSAVNQDTARSGEALRHAFGEAFARIAAEFDRLEPGERSSGRPSDEALLIVTLAIGSHALSRAMDGHPIADRIQRLAGERIQALIAGLGMAIGAADAAE
ncbi:MAG: TetR/AcrR family transcriptional regulator [Azospirillaceae bacterium]